MKPVNKRSTMLGRILFLFLLVTMVLGLLINVIIPDRKNSALENRPLQQFPQFSVANIVSGKTFDQWDDWFTDQFVFRDQYMHLGYLLKKGMGMKEINEVYLAKGRLIQASNPYDEQIVNENLNAVLTFMEHNALNTSVMIVPTSAIVNESALPKNAPHTTMDPLFDAMNLQFNGAAKIIDVRKEMADHQKEDLYYKTDHHWTSLGAYYAFSQFALANNITTSLEQFDKMPVSQNFQGTLSSKTGDPFLKDQIDLYVYKQMPDYIMTRDGKDGKRTMYNESALDQKDQYQVFTGTNVGVLQIETDNDSDRRLIVFKDSYANTFLQFLIPYYRTITVVDPRYYYEDLTILLRQVLPTDALFLYNYDNFVSDANLSNVMSVYSQNQ